MQIINLTKESNEIQRVITLKSNRNKRHKYKEFVIEGRVAIEEANQKNWKITSYFFQKDYPLSQWALNVLKNGEKTYAVSSELMEKISDKTDPSELVAVVAQLPRSFASFDPLPNDVIVVMDEPKSAGNVGMMIRSATAFGASALILSGHAADEYDPQCIRASRGTFFSLPIYRVDGVRAFSQKLAELKQKMQILVIATGDKGSLTLEKAEFHTGVLFLVLGNETSGISLGYQQIADQFVQIHLQGQFTSLNIAAAGSIFLYQIFRCRNYKND